MPGTLPLALFAAASLAFAQNLPAPAAQPRQNWPILDSLIEEAVKDDLTPGAVVIAGQNGRTIYQKSYGYRSLVPRKEAMTFDTVFDVASLTKVVATTSCIMRLVEQGKLRMADKVIDHLPDYQAGKSEITIRQLLTHFSGLRPDLDLEPEWSGYETGVQKALIDVPVGLPGTRFLYSDINFILLGEIVRKLSGVSLPEFAMREVFAPLGMTETQFQPPASLQPRIAPTEIVQPGGAPLRGVVHDPTTRYMGGIAGHAGLFSTATDLAKFAEMMLGMGTRKGVRVFSPLTVRAFTSPQAPPDQPVQRGLGWDIQSALSGNRGDLFPVGSYGHTGFTGTSLWIDPFTHSYVILLANSGHPKLRPNVTPLRGRVANVIAAGLDVSEPPSAQVLSYQPLPSVRTERNADVMTGLDVLVAERFASLKGKGVGLITNHTGISRDGLRNVDLMVSAGVQLKALYSPEHGIGGKLDEENIGSTRDAATGIPVWSLYSGDTRRPTEEMLAGIDVLVFDIQDVGSRFYTYTCTMLNAMEEAAQRRVPFVVLDRPNPLTGERVEGPLMEAGLKSFVGCLEMPLRHGMTMGEMARMANSTLQPAADLRVVAIRNWRREDWFDETGLPWVNPSPNMRSLNAALLYPGVGMLEYSKQYSVGRGTDAPFEQIGADWMDGRKLAAYLNRRRIPGVRCYGTRFTPDSSKFAGKLIEGVRFVITDRARLNSFLLGAEIAGAIGKLFPGMIAWNENEKLIGSREVVTQLESAADPINVEQGTAAGLERFQQYRRNFLLY